LKARCGIDSLELVATATEIRRLTTRKIAALTEAIDKYEGELPHNEGSLCRAIQELIATSNLLHLGEVNVGILFSEEKTHLLDSHATSLFLLFGGNTCRCDARL
jgi:hypothetical protein